MRRVFAIYKSRKKSKRKRQRITRAYRTTYHKGDEGKRIYKRWRTKVFRRDGYTCRLCRKQGAYLNAHHIVRKAWHPEMGYILSNGITLCESCHRAVTGKEEIFEAFLKSVLKTKALSKKEVLALLDSYIEIDKRWLPKAIKELKGEI